MTLRADSPPAAPLPDDTVTRLRVALRLAVAGGVADEVASRVGGDDDLNGLGRALRAVRSRLGLDRALRVLPLHRGGGHVALLGASSAVRPDEAVALIARVGLGLDVVAAADLLDTTPEHVAASLFAGRRALDRPIGKACDRFAEAIGEYDDPSADPDDRVALVTHARSCQSCRQAIDRSRQVDVWLQGELDRVAVGLGGLPPAHDRTTRLRPEVVIPAALVGVVALLVLGGFALFDRFTTGPHVPVSALAAPVPGDELSGWLVVSGQAGEIRAENLRTGETRELLPASDGGAQWPLMSPDRSRVALVRQVGMSTTYHADVYDLDGESIGSHDWTAEDAHRWPIGWLDDETLLAVESPMAARGESADAYQARLTTESALLAVDVASGAMRELARGDIGYAMASPDGTMIAIISNGDRGSVVPSLSLRPVTADGLGEPVWSHEMGVARLVWSPNSDVMYAAIIVGDPSTDGQSLTGQAREFAPAVVAVDRSGTTATLLQPRELGERAYPVTVAPDGRSLIVVAGDESGQDMTYWRLDLASGERVELEGFDGDGLPERELWSPDGTRLLLPIREPFYLSSGNTGMPYPGGERGVALFIYDADWRRRAVGGWLDTTRQLLAWLPEERFEPARPVPSPDAPTITAPEPLTAVRDVLQTSADSAASPDGRFVVLYDADANVPVIWDRQERFGRTISGDSSELSWLPGGRAVFGIVPFAEAANRLVGFAATSRDVITAIDFQRFDPAGLAENVHAHYQQPLVSPDGTLMTFFVVDDARGEVALWLAGWGREPRQVARWSVPADAIPDRPLAAAWIDDHTLLFARADDWDRGMPRQATLARLVVDGEETRVENLTSLDGRGVDRGVVLREIAVSPDGAQLAYRLRHYRSFDTSREVMDTVRVVALTDVTSPIEVASGGNGAGISWAPDGRWLVTSVAGRILVASSDGRVVRDVAEELPAAAHPVWVGNEVWFTVVDSDPWIWRVVVRE